MLRTFIISKLAVLLLLIAPLVQAGPKIEHWTSKQGLRVYYVHAPDLPMLDMRLVFDAGSARDADKAGLALLTNNMLNKGAAGMSEDQVAEAFESIGAAFSSGSSKDMAWLGLRSITLERELKLAVDTWLKVVAKPDFPAKDFERVQKLTLVGLQAEKQDPSSLANKAFFKALYGEHPYGQPENGTEASINALSTEDLRGFYQQYYTAQNGLLVMVGAVDRAQAEQLAEQVAAVLPNGKAAEPLPEVKPLEAAKTVRIPYPSTQAHILVGQIGNKRGDPDYFTMYMGNQILGGSGFTSRLMKEVRDARGLSYSVYSYFGPFAQLGVFEVGLQTKLEQTQEALDVVREVISQFQQEGPSGNELSAAQKDVSGGFPLRTASNSQIVRYLAVIAFYDLPLDYLDTFTTKINALNVNDIVDAFKRRLQPDKMVTVIVGGEASNTASSEAENAADIAERTVPQAAPATTGESTDGNTQGQ